MPTYCYTTECGLTFDRVFPIGKAPPTIKTFQGVAKRDLAAERKGVPARKGWPIECYASGVNAKDAQKLERHLAERGVPTEVTPDGDPIYRDPTHRKKALKVRGLHDAAGYD